MSDILAIINKVKTNDNYNENSQVLGFLLHVFENGKKPVEKADLDAISSFIFDEMGKLIKLIPNTAGYKEKNELFAYENILMGLFMLLTANKYEINENQLDIVKEIVILVSENQVLETAIDEMFKLSKIEKKDVAKILDIVKAITDEYQRGLFYQGLLQYRESMHKLDGEVRDEIASYIGKEFERYLKRKESLAEDEINNLEIASDVCQFFLTQQIIDQLKSILELKHNNVRYYAMSTLLSIKEKIQADLVAEMAKDLTYADLTYELLKKHNLSNMFPTELATPEYLAKSDMVHWLVYPTELGKVPDAIEFLGSVKVKGELYYIFKFMSDSDTLDDETKNKWLIGWSSNDGGTFSNFDLLSQFEQKNPQKTLKVIKKKLLG